MRSLHQHQLDYLIIDKFDLGVRNLIADRIVSDLKSRFMKTDSIFYRLFQSFPSIFFELIQLPITQAENYRFDSVEVKQLAFRIDGVFLPNTINLNIPIYFCEVQFQGDNDFYGRFFAEIFLYLSKTDFNNDWRGVVIYPNRRVESSNIQRYQDLLTSGRVNRIYLDELENINQNSLGIATIQLIIAKENRAIETARELIERVRTQLPQPQNLLQLIEMILVYKLPRLSRREIEAMFSLDELKQTRYFQDVREEGKLEGELTAKIASVPRLLALGLTVEQIAEALQLTIEQVRKIQKNN